MKGQKILLLMDLAIGLLREARSILNMVFPAVVIQLIVSPKGLEPVLCVVFAVSAALTGIGILIEVLQRSLSNYSLRALNYLILGLNRKAMSLNLADFEQSQTLQQFDKAYDGLWQTSDVDFTVFSVIFGKLISFAVTVYIFSTVHWGVAVLVFASLVVEFILNVRLTDKLHRKDALQSALSHKKHYITDTLFDSKTNKEIGLNGASDFFVGKYRETARREMEIEAEKKREICLNDMWSSVIECVRTVAVYAVAIARFMAGALPIANFTLFASAARQMTYAVWQIFQGVAYLFRASHYFEDVRQYMRIEESDSRTEDRPWPAAFERIEFRHVGYRYPNQKDYAVKDLSFTVRQGETVALVGDNGAGKSTALKLLMRLYPVTEGDILIDGKSIYSYDYAQYMAHFAPVFQDYMTYAFTVGENITFGARPEGGRMEEILRKVGLASKIASLPKGLDTPYTKRFDDNGVEFSGGEEQKLVIARAFVRQNAVMMMDEPTSALDPLAEYDIYTSVHALTAGCTAFFVSHRLNTTRFCEKILVLDHGTLREQGTHESLMEANGLYRRMFELQTEYYHPSREKNL